MWRVSLDSSHCCYEGVSYPPGSAITSIAAADGSSTASIDCVLKNNNAEMVVTVEHLAKPASQKQMAELKQLLETHANSPGKTASNCFLINIF